ncbi:Coiled-coil domain-containing protein 61 [Physocladia obscura]|uniref:Coiled-coil domain-containing protein 61 n=1 Tax=Physocladia obscura TaxID=109957 RepID=A0AAD5T971_9FUNG|nr:Coiled-coil domain-containing protein 61 [Physocladia obscura]
MVATTTTRRNLRLRGRDFVVIISVAPDVLSVNLSLVDTATINPNNANSNTNTTMVWRAAFPPAYIEEVAKKTGNFKRFAVFCEMLLAALDAQNLVVNSSAANPTVSLDLITGADLSPPNVNANHANTDFVSDIVLHDRIYLVLTYSAAFDRVHYPLPLQLVQSLPPPSNPVFAQLRQNSIISTIHQPQILQQNFPGLQQPQQQQPFQEWPMTDFQSRTANEHQTYTPPPPLPPSPLPQQQQQQQQTKIYSQNQQAQIPDSNGIQEQITPNNPQPNETANLRLQIQTLKTEKVKHMEEIARLLKENDKLRHVVKYQQKTIQQQQQQTQRPKVMLRDGSAFETLFRGLSVNPQGSDAFRKSLKTLQKVVKRLVNDDEDRVGGGEIYDETAFIDKYANTKGRSPSAPTKKTPSHHRQKSSTRKTAAAAISSLPTSAGYRPMKSRPLGLKASPTRDGPPIRHSTPPTATSRRNNLVGERSNNSSRTNSRSSSVASTSGGAYKRFDPTL